MLSLFLSPRLFRLLTALVLTALSGGALSGDLEFGKCRLSYTTPGDAECAVVEVAENPDEPGGRRIDLRIMRIPAINPTAKEPLFIVVGGPGGSATRSAQQYLPWFRGIQRTRDILFVDQRGTGGSNPFDCPFNQVHLSDKTEAERLAQLHEIARECSANWRDRFAYYTTPYAVHDLEQVRQALGYSSINIWGVSYGTRVVLEYMRRYPESLRAAVLDGAAPVAIRLPDNVARDGGRALAEILSACRAQAACYAAYGDLREKWVSLLEALQEKPLVVRVPHPRTQELWDLRVTPASLSSWVQMVLYSRQLVPLLPRVVHAATERHFAPLAGLALLASEELDESLSQGLQATILCAEDRRYPAPNPPEPEPPTAVADDASDDKARLLWLNQTETVDELCHYFATPPLPDAYFQPVVSDVPTLVLSGGLDPVTPPRWGRQVAEHLQQSRHLVAENAHHGVTMQGCAARLVRQFIETADLTAIDPACLESIAPAAFFVDGAGPMMKAGQAND